MYIDGVLTLETKNYSFWTNLLVFNTPEQCGIILCSHTSKRVANWAVPLEKQADTTSNRAVKQVANQVPLEKQ